MFPISLRVYLLKKDVFQTLTKIQKFSSAPKKSGVNFVAIKLQNKRIIRVSGSDSFIYLQSLLTNDMRQLLPVDRLEADSQYNKNVFQQIYSLNQSIIYSYICSAVGKVLCDLFIYRSRYRAEDGEYLLEVDGSIANAVKRLLLGYNLSRNVKVEIANDFDIWTVIPELNFTLDADKTPTSPPPQLVEIDSDDIKLVSDPRIRVNNILGYRFLTRLGAKRMEDFGKFCKLVDSDTHRLGLKEGALLDYNLLRYRFGVSEGIEDNLSGHYFPFELNGDILNAVSLNKGLYTSEEKIIKIYSNKGIKQRIFPVEFLCSPENIRTINPAPRTLLRSSRDRRFAELRQRIGRYGIASIFVPNNFDVNRPYQRLPILSHIDTGLRVKPIVPFWWPKSIVHPQLPIPDYPRCMFNIGSPISIEFLEESSPLQLESASLSNNTALKIDI